MLSVVIATHDSERALLPTLAALVPGATAGIVREVVVVDSGSTDRTTMVADIAGCRILTSTAPLGARLRAGAGAARGVWLMFLQPGLVPDPTWIGEVTRFVRESESSGLTERRAATFRMSQASASVLGGARALLRSVSGRRPQSGLIVHRRLYEACGGHIDSRDPEREIMRRLGRRIVALPSTVASVRPDASEIGTSG